MSTNLTGNTIASTFNQLLHVDGGPTATEKTVYSGTGVATALKIGTNSVSVENVQLDGNTIRTLDTNGNLNLSPNGTGSVAMSKVAITGGSITGITALAIADGGTGASTAADARTNLGLGTMATQNSDNVAITGGSISGVTLTGKLTAAAASAAGGAGLNLPHGAAPTAPSDGDVWTTTSGVFARVDGATKTVAFTDSSITGNAATATKLQTARTLTIGNTGKSFDGSANVSWTLSEIGAQDTLVSGTNIKTINGESLLGGGDLVIMGAKPTLQGDTSPYVTQTKTYQITNYSSFSSYAVSASAGTASISGDTITFTAPATAGSVNLTLTVDGQPAVFAINVQFVPIPTPTPTPANFGDPLEGGFYAGMIWNELVQSATSTTIGTGSKTFAVPSMTGAPIVYAGQQLEVRSRANPANKMVGTVTDAVGTSLTLNVTSVGGSGTFADWSIMSRYRVIVAPKASGENASVAIKNANTALPTACQTLTEGLRATQAMRDADTSTVYPAAHWARSLNINGFSDWYIPARDELELCWRNLKPVTDNNYATADRATGATPNYANNGSYGDTANTHGRNNNSAPVGAAYTSGAPAQTAAAAFRTGGAEAFEYGSAVYWTSSEYSAITAWSQLWYSSNPGPGYQNIGNKDNAYRVRAVRRSVI